MSAANQTEYKTFRVSKTFAPNQNGAKRFAKRYPNQLVCVRHRLSNDGLVRHTTIELHVESTPVSSRAGTQVALKLDRNDKQTRLMLMASGGKWTPKKGYWLVPRSVAKNLRLLTNIVPI